MRKNLAARKSPTTLFFLIIAILSVALASSALHTFFTLRQLRSEFLENTCVEIANSINRSVRGPGKWMNASLWRQPMLEAQAAQLDTIALLAVLDESGRILVGTGAAAEPADLESLRRQLPQDVFLYTYSLLAGRGGPRWEQGERLQGSRLAVGIFTAPTDSLLSQARLHLVISGITIIALWVLSYYLLRTTNRFLELKVREESEKHLANLGRLSATLAHEIRNPLGAMKGLSQVVQEQIPRDHPAQPMMDTVVQEARRLENLVNDLLSFARPSAAVLSEFDLSELTNQVKTLLQNETVRSEVTITSPDWDQPFLIRSDQDGLKQVLLNVLRNAVEASPRGGLITISFQKTGKNQGAARLSICDQGNGIESIDPEELFQPFATTKVRGSGLGLAVSRQIIERLGGRISLSNRPTGGACCTIELPVTSTGA